MYVYICIFRFLFRKREVTKENTITTSSSEHYIREYFSSIVQYIDLENIQQGALKLFKRLTVAQHLTETLYVVFFP